MSDSFVQHTDPLAGCSRGISGLAPFVRIVHDFSVGTRLELPPRRITDHALLYVQHGNGEIRGPDGTAPFAPGTVMIVPPWVEHGFLLTDASHIRMLNAHFDPVWEPGSVGVHWEQDPRRRRRAQPPRSRGLFPDRVVAHPTSVPASYESRFAAMLRRFPAADAAGSLELRAAAIELIAWLLRDLSHASEAGTDPDDDAHDDAPLERVRDYLDHARGGVSLADLERVSGIGRTRLCARFRRRYGLTPIAWMRLARIERAKAELAYAGLTVKAVAERAGFVNVHHFTRVFTRLAGQPPATFQRRFTRG